jgi:hypothetical protein
MDYEIYEKWNDLIIKYTIYISMWSIFLNCNT